MSKKLQEMQEKNRKLKKKNRKLQAELVEARTEISNLSDVVDSQQKEMDSATDAHQKENRIKDGMIADLVDVNNEMRAEFETGMKKMEARIRRMAGLASKNDGPSRPTSHGGTSKELSDIKKERRKLRAKREGIKKKPRGGQTGHRGATNKLDPDRKEDHAPKKCRGCGSTRLRFLFTRFMTQMRVLQKQINEVVQNNVHVYECMACGCRCEPDTAGRVARRGQYAPEIVMEVIMMFLNRLPYRRIADYMTGKDIQMTATTVYDIIKRVGTAGLGPPSKEVLDRIRQSYVLNADETMIRLNGAAMWIWVFYNPETADVLYLVRPSRGIDVLYEVLGQNWKGILVCDGWRAYSRYAIQRCTAHLTRETETAALRLGTGEAIRLDRGLHRIMRDARRSSKRLRRHPVGERREEERRLVKRVLRLAALHIDDGTLHSIAVKLKNAAADMFRFVANPRIPPTNNAAERALRELVIHRKIRGGLRSNSSMEWFGNVFTCCMTWKNRGLDLAAKLVQYA